jgi:hypothetical protein
MSVPANRMPVQGGMNDEQAGAAFADYIEAAGGDDIDVFDGAETEKKPSAKASTSDDSPTKAATDAGDEKPDAVDEQDGEETEVEASADDADDDDESDDTDAEPETVEVAELAGFLGVDESMMTVSDDGTVLVNTQVDGVQGKATLGELVKGYQSEAFNTRKSQKIADERREIHERATNQMAQLDGAIQQATQMAEAMKGRTLAKYQSINWEELRAQNPGEYAATYQQMQQEVQSLDYEVANLQQVRANAVQHSEAERLTNHNAWVGQQRADVFEHIPELANEETRNPLLKEYQTYLTGIGFNDSEIQGILDSRHLRIINDAVAGRRDAKTTTDKKEVKVPISKKLARVPRTLKAGSAATSAAKPKRTNRTTAAKRLKGSGSDEDAARFAIESGIVDSML